VTPPLAPVVRYGDHPDQLANLHLPAGEGGPWPVVVIVHGGFWRERWDRTTVTPLARDLAARGYLAWNVEYRRVGQEGGGWPGTLDDVAAAVDALADVDEADTGRVVAVGHSAGGHLALWLAGRDTPRVRVRAAVSLAGVADLESGARAGLGDGAVADLLGGSPDEVPERYAHASPAALVPLGVPQLLVHGGRDETVPPAQSRDFAESARAAGDEVELVELARADHVDVIDPGHEAWAVVVERLPRLLGI
jgi:acetyl esterase/lipase